MSNTPFFTSTAGVAVPRILYGTAWKKERTTALVLQAFRAGFRGIDTACQPKHYDEAGVGGALRQLQTQGIRRGDYYLQTKFTPLSGQDPERVPYDPSTPLADQVAQSFAASCRNLHTDQLDGLILHSPLPTPAQTLTAWRAMEQIQQQGGTRQLGISNCYDLRVLQTLYQDAQVKPALVQNRFYAATGYDRDLRAWCKARGILYQSFWTLSANPQLLENPVLTTIARRHDKTPAQTLFGFLGQQGVVPLTGTTSAQHMKEDLASFDDALTVQEIERLDQLLQPQV